jgi:hypothetical protein
MAPAQRLPPGEARMERTPPVLRAAGSPGSEPRADACPMDKAESRELLFRRRGAVGPWQLRAG